MYITMKLLYILYVIFSVKNLFTYLQICSVIRQDFSSYSGFIFIFFLHIPCVPQKNDTWLLKIKCKSCRIFNNQVSFFWGTRGTINLL